MNDVADTLHCTRCHLSKPEAEMTMNSRGWWLCQACQAQLASQEASQVIKQGTQPMSATKQALLMLSLLALAGLIMFVMIAVWYGEGMRRAL